MFRVVFLLSALCSSLYAASKPNVLLICVDDLKPVLGCYGDKIVKSPHIDRLAQRGVLFEKAFCNQAVCSPSRNALLTGLRSQSLGIYDLATNFRKSAPDAVTLPQHFKMNGYRVEGLGKIFHVGHGNVNDEASWSVPHFSPKTISYVLPENNPPESTREQALFENKKEAWKLPRGAPTEAADVSDNKYGDGMIADEAIKRLEAAKAKPDEPFFLAVGFLKPHLPFVAPKNYWDLYDPSVFTLPELQTPPEGAPEFAPSTWGELRQYKDMPEKGPVTKEQAMHLIHGYHAATSYMDAQLGRVIDALAANGFAENTIIVLWGDHGWHLGEKLMTGKNTLWDRSTKVPLIFAGPGVKAGQVCQRPAELLDIFPTLLALTKMPARSDLEGHSLVPQLQDASAPREWPAITTHNKGNHGIRTEDWRYIHYADGSEELYDMKNDPNEWTNLAGDSNYAAKKAELAKWLPKIDKGPVPGSKSRVLTYDPETREAVWEDKPIDKTAPLPEP